MKIFYLITNDGTAKAKIKIADTMYPSQGHALDTVLPMYFRKNRWKLVTAKEYKDYKPLID